MLKTLSFHILLSFQPQLLFTFYIRANLGPGQIEWLSEYVQFDERIFSIVISFLRIIIDRAVIHSTNMGEQKLNFGKFAGIYQFLKNSHK